MTDIQAVKCAAAGRWPEIISTLGGIEREVLDGRHHGCPKCGGNDRFRMVDEAAGAVFCNQCFSTKNGDGFAATGWLTGLPFPAAVDNVAKFLGINGYAKASNKADRGLALDQVHLPEKVAGHDTLLSAWCKAKPPIIPETVKRYDGRYCQWPTRSSTPFGCVSFVGRGLDEDEPRAMLLYRADGKQFPKAGSLPARKTHTLKGSRESWIFPGTAAELLAASTIIKCEGPPDCLAIASAGLPAGWVAITNTCGAKSASAKKLDFGFAVGKTIILVGDADQPGQDGAKRFARSFIKAGAAEVRLVVLPYDVTPDHGKDLRDYLNDGHTAEDFLGLVDQAELITPETVQDWTEEERKQRADRPGITIGTDESRVLDQAVAALGRCPNVYQRGGCLVHVVAGTTPPPGIARPHDAPRIAIMKHARIREHLADAADWFRTSGEDVEQVHPPDWVVKGIDARGQWGEIRRIEAVVESPVLRADGTVLQAPGYDAQTGIYFQPQDTFPPIPERPSRGDALQAVATLLEVVRDFPYATDAHRAGWLAATMTPLARYAIAGPAPMFLFDANIRGCGKSLQVDASSMIAAGRAASRMTMPKDDDEFRKRITALAVAGEPLILIDNINGVLGNASLDAALTATSWSDRILGQTTMASGVPLYATWYATGNNVVLAADTARRTVHVRLESAEENPEERSNFLHTNLLGWVRAERPRLTAAAITILAAYCAADRPSMGLTPWGSFEAWSDLVRNAVVWAGLPDPGSTRTALASQSDREAVALRQLMVGWSEIDPSGAGMTVLEIVRTLAEHPDSFDAIRGAIWELAPPRDGRNLNPRSVGMKLHHLRRRVVGGYCLDRRDSSTGTAIWVVRKPEEFPGTTGTTGTSQDSARAHTHAHAHENREATGSSPFSPGSPGDCQHRDIREEKTSDGYVNRQCRTCGEWFTCKKAPA